MLGRKIVFYVFILIFFSEISLVISGIISLHDWFTLAAAAADKNCIDNTL